MSIWWPICFMVVVGSVWLTTSLQSRKLYLVFLAKYPKEAQELIPFAFSNMRHPEKFVFFFRKTSLPMLKKDDDLWRIRQRVKMLSILSLILPVVCMGILGICAWIGI